MKKPNYQVIYDQVIPVLAIIVVIATGINEVKSAISLLNYRMGAYMVYSLVVIWWALAMLVSAGKIKWISKTGYRGRPRRLDGKIHWGFGICILLIAIPTAYGYFNKADDKPETVVSRKAFKPANRNFKVLILPWYKECDYQGKKYDIGYVIAKRLENIDRRDSIGISLCYIPELPDLANFTSDSAFSLMKFHNADMVLNGSYSLSECEGGSSDKVCFKYQVDPKNWGLEKGHTENNEYKMSDFHKLDDIRYGAGQEDIDYIIYWVAGMSELRRHRYARAIEMFSKISDYGNKVAVLFQVSNCYFYMKDHSRGRLLLEQVLKIDPGHVEANIHLAMMHFGNGNKLQAKKLLESLHAQNTEDPSILRDLCILYKDFGDTLNFNESFKKFVALIPKANLGAKDIGRFYEELGHYAAAKASYEEGFKVCSHHADDWNGLGRINLLLGDTLAAKPYFVQALKIDSNFFKSLYYMGLLSYHDKQYDAALNYLQRAHKKDADDEKVLVELGKTYEQLQKRDSALVKYEIALRRSPNNPYALLNAAVIYMLQKQFDTANVYLDRFMRLGADDLQLLNKIAYICADKENYPQAESYYRKMLQKLPRNPAILYNLASMRSNQQSKTDAMQFLAKALAVMPSLKEKAKKDKSFEWIRNEKKFISMVQ